MAVGVAPARGEYYPAVWEMTRGAMVYPVLTIAAIVLAAWAAATQRSAAAVAALLYAVLTMTFNYEGVWVHLAPVERLTIDLFVALALVTVQPWGGQRVWPRVMAMFWLATAVYVLFGTYEAAEIRSAAIRLLTG